MRSELALVLACASCTLDADLDPPGEPPSDIQLDVAPDDTNGIPYLGGNVMSAPINVYYLWYGNWGRNTAPTILTDLANSIGDTYYWYLNGTYYDRFGGHVSRSVRWAASISDSGSHGQTISDGTVFALVSEAIANHQLADDPNGVYFVLTAPDVVETNGPGNGFCTKYCGWHDSETIGSGTDIKVAFVGDPATQCAPSCTALENLTTSPNNNVGADAMASVIAHELDEAATDPFNAGWRDMSDPKHPLENADKCAWHFGPEWTTSNGGKANVQMGSRFFLLQENWENARGGGCRLHSHYDNIGGVVTSAPAVASWGTNRLDVFARGTDNVIYHDAYDGSWHGWEAAGTKTFVTKPAAVSWGPNRIDLFAVASDKSLYHRWWDGSIWHDWENLGGLPYGTTIASAPTVASWGPNRLDVFVQSQDGLIYQKTFDGFWERWTTTGMSTTSAPAAVSSGMNRIDIFARANNHLVQQTFNGSWGVVTLRGSVAISGDVGVSTQGGAGNVDIFANSVDNTLLHASLSSSTFADFESLGNPIVGGPAAASWSSGRIDVFMQGDGGAVWHKFFDSSGWSQ